MISLPYAVDELELVRSVTMESFYEFVLEFWETIIAEPLIANWHLRYLCNDLQRDAELVFSGKPKRKDKVVNVPPGTTKSTIYSVMFPAWAIARNPSTRIICGSHTHELVLDLSRKSRDVVRSEKYQLCFPHVRLRTDQDTKGYWATSKGGFRFSCTVGGKTPTGFHGHFLIVDDPLDPETSLSEAGLKAANRWMTETLPSRKVNKRTSLTVLIMQRLHQHDPAGYLIERYEQKGMANKIKHICLPAEITDDISPKSLRKYYVDGLLDPDRLPLEVLTEAKLNGQYMYAGQYLQSPIPLGGGMFKTEMLKLSEPPNIGSFRKVVRYWDKAGTEDGGAYTAGVLMGEVLDPIERLPVYWILDVVRGQWEAFSRESIILQTAKMDGTRVKIVVEQEPGSSGKESAQNTVRRLAGFRAKMDRPTGDKIYRADPFSAQVNAGNVRLRPGRWNHDYIEEMRFFGRVATYKDQIDASSGAFAHLVKKRVVVS